VIDPKKVLFVGLHSSVVGWYRCFSPAMHLGADWVGLTGSPPNLTLRTGLVKGQTQVPNFLDYEVIVLQQPRGEGWRKKIRAFQERGIKVVFEVDDYLHAIRKMKDHDFSRHFDKKALASLETNMRISDAVICSTDYIARRYRKFNPNIHVCENALDLGRYRLTKPERPTVNIGWQGATGHTTGMIPWLRQVAEVMGYEDDTCFVSIGQPFADALKELYPDRCISVPFTSLDIYPAPMTLMDIALAPAGKGQFFKGKSDLRWLEASALSIPLIGDPDVYPKIEHGVTGFHAETPEEAGDLLLELVRDLKLRLEVGANARAYVEEHRDMSEASARWAEVLTDLVEDRTTELVATS